ncbi:NAD(P)H-dependent oxidoreductase [Klebsiella pneumoniae]|uniref:FMN dependent NADH:quinone oxidoreductase n=1 Tax=Klebsiella pneumoniae TaxID=573 RepID=A0A939NNU6_KLEPN|nr:NAD(P)H-dependent oxidoreductase [Klebsiella pneumoniae]
MANVLVLKSSINGETSLTNQLINEFRGAPCGGHGDRLIEHDLSAMALPTLDRPLFAALRGAVDPQPAIREAVALSDQLIAELKASDLLVIGAPMYNLNVPTDLKMVRPRGAGTGNLSLHRAAAGAGGGRPAVVVSSRGIHRGETTDAVTPYLRAILGLMGIREVEFIYAEGLDNRPHGRDAGIASARAQIARLAVPA